MASPSKKSAKWNQQLDGLEGQSKEELLPVEWDGDPGLLGLPPWPCAT